MQIRLERKLADYLDGVDVSAYRQGDIVELPRREAELLIAERWAVPFVGSIEETRRASTSGQVALAAERLERRTVAQMRRLHHDVVARHFEDLMRRLGEEISRTHVDEHGRRRAEDRIRDELRDERATILHGGRRVAAK